MKNRYKRLFTYISSFVSLFCLLAACGQSGSASPTVGATGTVQVPKQGTATPGKSIPTASASPVLSTQTACPANGMARAMVTAPLVLGTHQTLVYVIDESAGGNPTSAILRRYDVLTGAKTDIVTLPNVSIAHAQLSPDGQWLLFTATDKLGSIKLQMVRLDGQGLQRHLAVTFLTYLVSAT